MGLAIVFLTVFAVFLVIVGALLLSSVILWIVAAIRKKKGKNYKGFRNAGFICLVPIVLMILWASVTNKKDEIKTQNLLSYKLFHGDLYGAEALIDGGVSPNCTIYTNEEAKLGEYPILYTLAAPAFMYNSDLEGLVNEDNRMEFMEFLLEHGADPDVVVRYHETDYEEHFYEGASWRKRSDFCGDTPIMHAIRCQDLETVRFLIEHGADVNAVDDCGYNAAAIAVSELSQESMQPFLELLAENGCDMNIMNNYNLTTKEMYENKYEDDYPY